MDGLGIFGFVLLSFYVSAICLNDFPPLKLLSKKHIMVLILNIFLILYSLFMLAFFFASHSGDTMHNSYELRSCEDGLKTIGTGVEAYYKDKNKFPEKLGDLVPKYVEEQYFRYPHPQKYVYKVEGNSFVIYCEGRNHIWATEKNPFFNILAIMLGRGRTIPADYPRYVYGVGVLERP